MSATDTELTDAEAAAIDAQLPDEGSPAEPEPEPEPEDGEDDDLDDGAEAERPDRTGDIEKTSRSLEREAQRHFNRVQELMGPDFAGLVGCELCWNLAPGFRWDRSPDEQTAANVRVALGMPDLSNFAPSATERQCDDCRGLGKVRTGSSVPSKESITCDACAGKGYVNSRPRLNPDALPAEGTEAPSGEAPVYNDGIKRDMFGTPETDPDYNLMPNVRARPVDYWQTHRE